MKDDKDMKIDLIRQIQDRNDWDLIEIERKKSRIRTNVELLNQAFKQVDEMIEALRS